MRRWQDVAQDKEFALLPPDSPSRRAAEIYSKAFPEDQTSSNIVLVLHRAGDWPPAGQGMRPGLMSCSRSTNSAANCSRKSKGSKPSAIGCQRKSAR